MASYNNKFTYAAPSYFYIEQMISVSVSDIFELQPLCAEST